MREARTSLTVATILVLLGGSSGVATAEAGVGTVSLSAGCDKPIVESGDYEGVNDVGDDAERYWVVVPESYGQNAPLPLVLWLSSGGGFVDSNYAGWRPYLDDIDVLFAVASTETERSLETDTMLALLDRLEADFCIDLRRIHVMGESSSSGAVGRLACAGSQRIASFLGGMGGFDAPGCVPERPVPLFALTGDQDRWIVAPSVERWATANGCDADPLVWRVSLYLSGLRRRRRLLRHRRCRPRLHLPRVHRSSGGVLSGIRGGRPARRRIGVLRTASHARVTPSHRLGSYHHGGDDQTQPAIHGELERGNGVSSVADASLVEEDGTDRGDRDS
jgi:hypothetical protein